MWNADWIMRLSGDEDCSGMNANHECQRKTPNLGL
jgi:hypothetical protein